MKTGNESGSAASPAASDQGAQIALFQPAQMMRQATDIAEVCRQIVIATAVKIQGRDYVKVEGWTSIATAHGCCAASGDCKEDDKGTTAVAYVRRMSDGVIISTAEGFVGRDELTWYGGIGEKDGQKKTYPKRSDQAIRAMAQTRAVSRVCRTAFAHVVVMMNAGLATTPAEEMSSAIDVEATDTTKDTTKGTTTTPPTQQSNKAPSNEKKSTATTPGAVDYHANDYQLMKGAHWQDVEIHFGTMKGAKFGDLTDPQRSWYLDKWKPKPFRDATDISDDDKFLLAAVQAWRREAGL